MFLLVLSDFVRCIFPWLFCWFLLKYNRHTVMCTVLSRKHFFFTNAQFIDVKLLITFSFNICRLCNISSLLFLTLVIQAYSVFLHYSSMGIINLFLFQRTKFYPYWSSLLFFFFYFTCSIFLFLSLYFLEAEVILFITFYYGYLANCFTAFLL